MDFSSIVFLLCLAIASRAYWKYRHTPEHITIDSHTKELIDELFDLKARYNHIEQFIFTLNTQKSNEYQSYSIKWADILGHDKEAEIFFGNAHNLRGKKLTQNLRHVAEDYQNELARQIHDKVNELNSHHQKNVKLHGSTLWNVAASNGKESAEK